MHFVLYTHLIYTHVKRPFSAYTISVSVLIHLKKKKINGD